MGRKPIPVTPNVCLHCGKPLERKRFSGRLEDRAIYSRRKFCDLVCAGLARTDPSPSESALRKRYLGLKGKSCETCETTEKLCLHHKNRNPANNDPSNTMTLCESCHTKWHWEHDKVATPKQATVCIVCGKAPTNPRDHIRRGMCQMHYQRWKKHGDPDATRPPLR